MKKAYGIILGLMVSAAASASFGQNVIDIPQVSNTPIPGAENAKEPSIQPGVDNVGTKDYQEDVLSNPAISDVARAAAMTGSGGNTAVIVQEGSSNNSSVKQTGNDNYASQTQNGKSNDLRVEQNGNHNQSQENQTGNYNHKVKIQNGNAEESTTIDQVGTGSNGN